MSLQYPSEEGYAYQTAVGLNQLLPEANLSPSTLKANSSAHGKFAIFDLDKNGKPYVDPGPGPFLPVWETSPVLKRNWVNRNLFQDPVLGPEARRSLETNEAIIGRFQMAQPGSLHDANYATSFYASLLSVNAGTEVDYNGDPMSTVYVPVFNSFSPNRTAMGVLTATVHWASYFRGILPSSIQGVIVVLENSCNDTYTYQIDGEDVIPIGAGDLHNPNFDAYVQSTEFSDHLKIEDGTIGGLTLNQDQCRYSIHVYPSDTFYNDYYTSTPNFITLAVGIIFVFTVAMFFVYDRLVERRQKLVLRTATQSTAIVSSLFPEKVRERLMQETNDAARSFDTPNRRLKSYLQDGVDTDDDGLGLAPIADLVPHSTVLFADISGFTAWSSTRDPAQVFILLQTVYQAFDKIAKRRKVRMQTYILIVTLDGSSLKKNAWPLVAALVQKVFKVETIGDSYVAVTGLPEPQKDHAVIMAKFAGEVRLFPKI